MIPVSLARTISSLHGDVGREWIARLPALLPRLADDWGLELGQPFSGLSYHYVTAAARRLDGLPVVLKLGVPRADKELIREVAALRFYDGRGVARLLEADLERGALLLERVRPGKTLADHVIDVVSDDQATRTIARVMRRVWRTVPLTWQTSAPSRFPTLTDWSQAFARLRSAHGGQAGPFPAPLVEEAETLFRDLLASASETVLLHGDLHHGNILAGHQTRDGREPWLAIDPQSVIGEPAFEIGVLLHNPGTWLLQAPDPKRLLSRRLDILTEELSLPRERLRGWGIAQSMLSAVWCWEDGLGPDCWDLSLRVAGLLSDQK